MKIYNLVQLHCEEKGVSLQEFSDKAEVSRSVIYYLKIGQKVSDKSLKKVAEVLELGDYSRIDELKYMPVIDRTRGTRYVQLVELIDVSSNRADEVKAIYRDIESGETLFDTYRMNSWEFGRLQKAFEVSIRRLGILQTNGELEGEAYIGTVTIEDRNQNIRLIPEKVRQGDNYVSKK